MAERKTKTVRSHLSCSVSVSEEEDSRRRRKVLRPLHHELELSKAAIPLDDSSFVSSFDNQTEGSVGIVD
jgi:hypothetical protein